MRQKGGLTSPFHLRAPSRELPPSGRPETAWTESRQDRSHGMRQCHGSPQSIKIERMQIYVTSTADASQ